MFQYSEISDVNFVVENQGKNGNCIWVKFRVPGDKEIQIPCMQEGLYLFYQKLSDCVENASKDDYEEE